MEEENRASAAEEETKDTKDTKDTQETAAKQLVSKDMLVGEVISRFPNAAFALMQCGMGCISCPASQGESLADASMVHGLNADEVVEYVNEYLAYMAEQEANGDAEETQA